MERKEAVMVATLRVVVLFVFLAAAGPVSAQTDGAIRGQVVAATNGSAIADSLLTLIGAPIGGTINTRTDASGTFVFPRVPPGDYVLSISADGFSPRDLRFVLEPREVRTLTVALEVGRVEVSLDVTGSFAPLPGTHSPSSTTLTGARLESTPVFQRTTLSDAIVTLAPGMIRGHDDFVHIRGHEVALNPLINGVSFWENTHVMFSAGVSPEIIETANAMTGGFSAEYGNRFGGVVDIVTKSGLRMRDRGAVNVSGGGAGRRGAGAELGGSRGRFGYFAVGSIFQSDRFLSPPDAHAIHDGARGAHAFVQLDGSVGALGSIRTILMGAGTDFEIPVTPRDVNLRPRAIPEQDTRQQTAVVGWTRPFGDVAVSTSFYQRWSRARLFPAEGPLTARAQLERSLVTLGVKSDATRFVGRHALKAGIDVVRLRPRETLSYDDAGYVDFTHLVGLPHTHVVGQGLAFAGTASGGQVSGYVQDGIRLGRRVTADIGLRLDHYDLLATATHASPRVNLAVQIGDATVLHTSYNHFFVSPPIEGVLSSSAGLTRSIEEIGLGLPGIDPTVEDQFEAGLATVRGPVQLALTTYYRATDNPVHTTVWPDSRIYSYASFDRARAYGLEAKADLRTVGAPGAAGYVNYALGRVHFFNPVTGGFVTEAAHLTETNRFLAPMDQTHTLTAGVTYRHAPSRVWLGGTIEYGSGTPMGHGGSGHDHGEPQAAVAAATDVARVPGHFTAGGSIGLTLLPNRIRGGTLTLQLDVENIANNIYVIAQEGEFSPAQFSLPRVVSLSAKFRF
jgi:outer membrane receptor for ferrienterochelin and colicins